MMRPTDNLKRNRTRHGLPGLTIMLFIAGCTSQPSVVTPTTPSLELRDAIPKVEPRSKYGNPPFYEVKGRRYFTLSDFRGYVERGVASWYGPGFHGKRTSSGEPYDMRAMTAAHTTLPLPTYVYVTNLKNGRTAILRVNDRGPFEKNRLIDVSYSGAKKLGIDKPGTALVEIQALDPENPKSWPSGATALVAAAQGEKTSVTATTNSKLVEKTYPNNEAQPSIYLQVAAFSSMDNAEHLHQRLQESVAANYSISPIRIDQQTFYRLRLGPLDSVEAADRLLEPLDQLGIHDPLIVVD
ncbi:rare lipoprotein A [Gammaproteobacteria bacterium]